ncbi:MAG: alpha/beta fold hydrolase [Terracidiphilus sp.]
MNSKSYIAGGARLNCLDSAGSGVPVIFLHPTPLDYFYWLPLINHLSNVRAIVPDLRGHGASELGTDLPTGGFARVPDAPMLTTAQLASDIIDLLDHLALREAVFVGCSIGGYVMLELWRRDPERMRGLAFICSKPQPDIEANFVRRVDTITKARAGGREELFDGMAQASIGASARARRPSIVPELRSRMVLTSEAIVAVQAGLAARPDSVPTVSTIRVPVFGISGGEDFAVSPVDMEAFRSAQGGCELHTLADAGHFAAYEQPENVSALLAAWLHQFGV